MARRTAPQVAAARARLLEGDAPVDYRQDRASMAASIEARVLVEFRSLCSRLFKRSGRAGPQGVLQLGRHCQRVHIPRLIDLHGQAQLGIWDYGSIRFVPLLKRSFEGDPIIDRFVRMQRPQKFVAEIEADIPFQDLMFHSRSAGSIDFAYSNQLWNTCTPMTPSCSSKMSSRTATRWVIVCLDLLIEIYAGADLSRVCWATTLSLLVGSEQSISYSITPP